MTEHAAPAESAQRYGWVIVGIAFVVMGTTGGLTFYAMAAYIDALVDDRGFSLAAASAGPTMSSAFGGVGGLFTARLMKTMPVRRILIIGIIGLSAAIAMIGASHNVLQLWAAFAMSGWFGSMASGIPVSTLVARWFPAAPARPLVLAMTGMSFGGALIPPLVIGVISWWGLGKGSVVLAIGMLVLVGTAILFVKEPPAGLPGGAAARVSNTSVLSRMFLLLICGMLFLFMSQIATTMHLVRLANENGTGGAGLALSVMALGTFVGRLGGIPVLPAIGLRKVALATALTQATAQFVISGAYTAPHLYAGAFLLGVAMGNVAILSSLFCIEAFGLAEYPRMMARMSLAGPIGSGIGPLIVAVLHGALDGYRWPMIAMGSASIVGALLLFLTGIDSSSSLRDRRARRRGAALQDPSAKAGPVPSATAEAIAVASADGQVEVSQEASADLVAAVRQQPPG